MIEVEEEIEDKERNKDLVMEVKNLLIRTEDKVDDNESQGIDNFKEKKSILTIEVNTKK